MLCIFLWPKANPSVVIALSWLLKTEITHVNPCHFHTQIARVNYNFEGIKHTPSQYCIVRIAHFNYVKHDVFCSCIIDVAKRHWHAHFAKSHYLSSFYIMDLLLSVGFHGLFAFDWMPYRRLYLWYAAINNQYIIYDEAFYIAIDYHNVIVWVIP